MTTVCICGGGSLGHVIAGYLAAKDGVRVNLLTRRPQAWHKSIEIYTPQRHTINARLTEITDKPETAVPNADIILLCLPGYAIKEELKKIQPYVNPGTFIGSVFSSTGFFFEALEIFGRSTPLWGFQRVPFIARTKEYGLSAHLLGYKHSHKIAVENCNDKETFRQQIETLFDRPTHLLSNHYEATFTNSNPILHPARLYSLFRDWERDKYYNRLHLFYEEWDNKASEYLIAMDNELFKVLDTLPVSPNYLTPILQHYESHNATSLTQKITSIESFKGIAAPMIKSEKGWQPDLQSRYFQEDFKYGLRYIYETAIKQNINVPTIEKIYQWGINLLNEQTK